MILLLFSYRNDALYYYRFFFFPPRFIIIFTVDAVTYTGSRYRNNYYYTVCVHSYRVAPEMSRETIQYYYNTFAPRSRARKLHDFSANRRTRLPRTRGTPIITIITVVRRDCIVRASISSPETRIICALL